MNDDQATRDLLEAMTGKPAQELAEKAAKTISVRYYPVDFGESVGVASPPFYGDDVRESQVEATFVLPGGHELLVFGRNVLGTGRLALLRVMLDAPLNPRVVTTGLFITDDEFYRLTQAKESQK